MPLAVPVPTAPRTVVGNRNVPPIYIQDELTFNTRNQRVGRTAASNARWWRDIELTYFTFQMTGAEVPVTKGFTFRTALEYQGVKYPVTFGGARDVVVPDGAALVLKSDPVRGLVVCGGGRVFERPWRFFTRLAAGNNLITHENSLAFGEWSYSSNDGVDYSLGGEPGDGAVGYLNLSGASIASAVITAGGSGYTGTVNLYAFDPHKGNLTGTLIGTRTVSSGVVLTGFIGGGSLSNVAGPWGPSTTLVIAPNGSALTKDAWCASLMTGIPDDSVESMLMNGDSIMRGYSAGDNVGDELRNYGPYERAIGGRIGVINLSYPGISVNGFLPFATRHPLCHSAYDRYANTVLQQVGSNDVDLGSSGGAAANLMSNLSAAWRTVGTSRIVYTTMPPRTTSIDAWTTLANQTPFANFQAGKGMEQLNAAIKYREGGLAGDLPPIDYHSVAADPTDPYRWRVDGGANTKDGSHPDGAIGVRIQAEALAKILPAFNS